MRCVAPLVKINPNSTYNEGCESMRKAFATLALATVPAIGLNAGNGPSQKIWGKLEYAPLSKAILSADNAAALKDPGDGKGPCVK